MRMNLISKTFSLAVLAGIISSLLSPTSSQAQTTPEMQTKPENIVAESTTSAEQMRQEYHRTLGQMQQMLGRMHQQVDRMPPEQLQQNRQQLEQMMEQIQQMLGQQNSLNRDSSQMQQGFNYYPKQ